jgi:hypothetical protein
MGNKRWTPQDLDLHAGGIDMKIRVAIAILIGTTLAGCIPLSLHPLYTEEDLVYDAGLEGLWGEDNDHWLFEKADENEYKLTVTSGENPPVVFSAHLVQLKEYTFLDLQASEVSGISDFSSLMLIPVHAIWQYKRDGDTFRLRTLDYDWMVERVDKKRFWIAHEEYEDWFIFTAEPKRLQRFFLNWVGDEDAYGDWEEIERLADVKSVPTQP